MSDIQPTSQDAIPVPSTIRMAVGGMLAVGIQAMCWVLGSWINYDFALELALILVPALIVGVLFGVASGMVLRKRQLYQLSHGMFAAFVLGATVELIPRLKLVFDILRGKVPYPKRELLSPTVSDSLVWLVPDILVWCVGGSIYWWITFRKTYFANLNTSPITLRVARLWVTAGLLVPLVYVAGLLFKGTQKFFE